MRTDVNGTTKYAAVYRTVDGSQRYARTFDTRVEAEAAYLDAVVKVGKGIDPSRSEETVYPATVKGGETRRRLQSGGFPGTS